jgi:hypothetical protein
MILSFLAQQIYDICSFIIPCNHDGVVISDSLSLRTMFELPCSFLSLLSWFHNTIFNAWKKDNNCKYFWNYNPNCLRERTFFEVHRINCHPQFELYTSRKNSQILIYICIYKLYLNTEAPRG